LFVALVLDSGGLGASNNLQEEFCTTGISAAILKVSSHWHLHAIHLQHMFIFMFHLPQWLPQGRDLSDSVLGVGTPGRYSNTGGVYFYFNLSATEPQDTSSDAELGLTRIATVRAIVRGPIAGRIDSRSFTDGYANVPNNTDTLYGEWCAEHVLH